MDECPSKSTRIMERIRQLPTTDYLRQQVPPPKTLQITYLPLSKDIQVHRLSQVALREGRSISASVPLSASTLSNSLFTECSKLKYR